MKEKDTRKERKSRKRETERKETRKKDKLAISGRWTEIF